MAKKTNNAEPTALQLNIERGLRIGAISAAMLHLLMSLYSSLADYPNSIWFSISYALTGLLVLSAAAYLIISRSRYPQTLSRISAFIRSILQPEFLLLALLFIWYLICCIAVGDHYNGNWLRGNAYPLLDTFINVFILFPLSAYMLPKHRTTVIHALIHFFAMLMTAFMVYVLFQVFQLQVIELPNGSIGMTADVRLTFFTHPNTSAAYLSILMMLYLYMIVTQKTFLKVLYTLALGIHCVALMLTNSRTCFIAVAISFALAAFMLLWHKAEDLALSQRTAICALGAALMLIAFWILRSAVFFVFESTTHFSELLAQQNAALTANTGAAPVSSAADISLNAASMHTRYRTWQYALQAMTSDAHKAVFGVTPISVKSVLDLMSGGTHYDSYTHNQFLEVGVSLGFPGLVIYLLYLILIAKRCLAIGLSREQKPHAGFYLIPISILMLVISNLTEGRLLFYHYFSAGFFFLLSGWIVRENREYATRPALKNRKPAGK